MFTKLNDITTHSHQKKGSNGVCAKIIPRLLTCKCVVLSSCCVLKSLLHHISVTIPKSDDKYVCVCVHVCVFVCARSVCSYVCICECVQSPQGSTYHLAHRT